MRNLVTYMYTGYEPLDLVVHIGLINLGLAYQHNKELFVDYFQYLSATKPV